MDDVVSLGPELFSDAEEKVISYKGANFYRACDEVVANLPDGGQSHCVKRVGHPGVIHEDYEGQVTGQLVGLELENMPIEQAVNTAIGAASACWDNLIGAGVFQSDRARDISQQLLIRIRQMGPIYE